MFDFHQTVLEDDELYDDGRVQAYIEGLTAAFAASEEAMRLPPERTNWVHPLLSFGFNYVGVSPADMTRNDFEEVLFDLFPRKVSTDADAAESIIVELRAFWTFAARQYAAANAATMLAVLNDRAVARLRTALSNPSNFGLAKSMFMTGSQGGFDMTTQEGLAAFMAAYNESLSTGPPLPPLPRAMTSDAKKKQQKAKRQQRQAKKQNRSR
jgi:hypothetical protein